MKPKTKRKNRMAIKKFNKFIWTQKNYQGQTLKHTLEKIMNQTIDEYVNTLSEEEKKQFKDLIKECKQREKEIEKLNIPEKIEMIGNAFSKMFQSVGQATQAAKALNKQCGQLDKALKEKQENKILKELPDEKYFNC